MRDNSENIAKLKLASLKEELYKSENALCTLYYFIESKILKHLLLITNGSIKIVHKGIVKEFIFRYEKVKDLGIFKIRLERKP